MLTDVLVPKNRWDLLAPYPPPRPTVSVVVPHYRQPEQLARTWTGLCRQTLPPREVIIVDDGSPVPPRAPTGGPPVRVLRQEDRGSRAARARNLGAAHSDGEVLVFLDADTVPDPGFLETLTRHVARCPDVMAVGRRRHADLSGLDPGQDPRAGVALADPEWLRRGYADSRDLLDADGRSFRLVISAVLACRRSLFDDLGGFDERFVGYGGEDWDLAYRAWNGGAVFVHEPDAVGWHDGADWAGRAGSTPGAKDVESIRLAAWVPEPTTRGAPLPGTTPDVLVDVPGQPDPSRTVRVVHSVLAQSHRDLAVRLVGPVDPALAQLYGPQLRSADWTADQLRRARARVEVCEVLPAGAVAAAMAELTAADLASVELRGGRRALGRVVSTRAAGRARRWSGRLPEQAVWESLGTTCLDVGPAPGPAADLESFFRSMPGVPR